MILNLVLCVCARARVRFGALPLPVSAQISSRQIKLQIENKWIDIKTGDIDYGRPIGIASAGNMQG